MVREEVPKTEIVHKKFLGGRMIEFGDNCWRNEAKKTKKGIHIIGTIPSNQIKMYHLVGKEAKIFRGERRGDQDWINSMCEVLLSSEISLLASFKPTDAIVPKICVLKPKKICKPTSPEKIGYAMDIVFIPSSTCYRALPRETHPNEFPKKCHTVCAAVRDTPSLDVTIDSAIQDYIGTVFIIKAPVF